MGYEHRLIRAHKDVNAGANRVALLGAHNTCLIVKYMISESHRINGYEDTFNMITSVNQTAVTLKRDTAILIHCYQISKYFAKIFDIKLNSREFYES